MFVQLDVLDRSLLGLTEVMHAQLSIRGGSSDGIALISKGAIIVQHRHLQLELISRYILAFPQNSLFFDV